MIKKPDISSFLRQTSSPVQALSQPDPQVNLIQQIVSALYPQVAPPPSFENSGLYNEADVTAQANADYQPTFQTEQQRLGQNQQQQMGAQGANYFNRGLGHSGARINAQNFLGQQQGYDTSDLQQQQRATLAGVKAKSYQDAFTRYLNQFSAK